MPATGTSRKLELVCVFLLLLAAIMNGSAFLVMKDVQEAMPLNYVLAIRFAIAALGLSYYVIKCPGRFSKTLLWQGAVTGALLFAAFSVQSIGLAHTTTSKNALLTSMYVVLVPFLLWVIRGESVGSRVFLSAVLCLFGIAVLTPNADFTLSKGDLLSMAGAVLYAAHILSVAIFSDKTEIMSLTCWQFTFAALYSGAAGLWLDPFPTAVASNTWLAIGWLAVAATLLALTFMNIGIRYVSSTKTVIILSTQAIFGCIFGTLFDNDPLTPPIIVGGSLIIVAVVLSQTKHSNKKASEPSAVEQLLRT